MVKARTLWTCCNPPGTNPHLAGLGLSFNSIQAQQGEHAANPSRRNLIQPALPFSKGLETHRKKTYRLPSPPTFRLPGPPVPLRPGDSAVGPMWGRYRPATHCTVG